MQSHFNDRVNRQAQERVEQSFQQRVHRGNRSTHPSAAGAAASAAAASAPAAADVFDHDFDDGFQDQALPFPPPTSPDQRKRRQHGHRVTIPLAGSAVTAGHGGSARGGGAAGAGAGAGASDGVRATIDRNLSEDAQQQDTAATSSAAAVALEHIRTSRTVEDAATAVSDWVVTKVEAGTRPVNKILSHRRFSISMRQRATHIRNHNHTAIYADMRLKYADVLDVLGWFFFLVVVCLFELGLLRTSLGS